MTKATELRTLENIEAEAALLGGLMIDNSFVDRVSEFLTHADFATAVHGRIFRAILRLRAHNEAATPTMLRPMFDDDEDLADIGGASYLGKLTASGAAVIGVMDYAKQVSELSKARAAREALKEALEEIEKPGSIPDVASLQGKLETQLWVVRHKEMASVFRSPGDVISNTRERISDAQAAGGVMGAKNAFISDLNNALGPLEPGTYNIVAARPSMGKTVLASSALLGYAANGHPGLYLHAEMTAPQMDMRVTADLAYAMHVDITHDNLKKGNLTAHQLEQLARVQERAAVLPVDYVAIGRCDVSKVCSLVARACAMWDAKGRRLEVVAIDYLQLLSAESILGARVSEPRAIVNAVSEALLNCAQRNGVALIALSQLSRRVEDRPGAVPQMSDLRESGRLEEDADSVTLLHRPEYYMERETRPTKPKEAEEWDIDLAACRGMADIIVTKNRHGVAMKRRIKFFGKHQAMRGSDYGVYDPLFPEDSTPLL